MAQTNQPSADQLLSALEKAHLAGDVEAAREFAAWHQELYAPEPEPESPNALARLFSRGEREPQAVDPGAARQIADFGRRGPAPEQAPLEEPRDPEIDGFSGAAPSVPQQPTPRLDTWESGSTGRRPGEPLEDAQQRASEMGQGPSVGEFARATPGMVGEGLAGAVGGTLEGLGLMADRAQQITADEQVSIAIRNLADTTERLAEAESFEEFRNRDEILGNLQEEIAEREQQVNQALIDLAEREPSKAAAFLRDIGVDIQELGRAMGPGEEFDGTYRDLVTGIGSMLAYYGPGLITSAATRGSAAAGLGVAASMAGPAGVSEQYSRALRAGLSEEEALERSIGGFPGGVVQVAPIAALVRPLPAEIQGRAIGQLYGILRAAGSEFVAENAGAILQNLVEQSYNPERGTWDDTPYQGLIAGGSSAILQAVTQLATRGRGMGASPRHMQREAGEQLSRDVRDAEFAVPADQVAAQQLDPSQAQLEAVTPPRPSMAELVSEKLRERGLPPLSGTPFAQGYETTPPLRAPVDVPFAPPGRVEERQAPEEVAEPDDGLDLRQAAMDAGRQAAHAGQPREVPREVRIASEEDAANWLAGHDEVTGRVEQPTPVQQEIEEAAAETDTEPTPAQAEVGNYRKGRVRLHGFEIAIENPQGSTRRGIAPDGTEWESQMAHHYGDIKGTTAADGDNLDVFIGPRPESGEVFIIDQVREDGSFDEHKVMLGFDSLEAAREGYLANYEDGWQGLGAISPTDIDAFRQWVDQGDTAQPFDATLQRQEQAVASQEAWDGALGQEVARLRDLRRRAKDDERGTPEALDLRIRQVRSQIGQPPPRDWAPGDEIPGPRMGRPEPEAPPAQPEAEAPAAAEEAPTTETLQEQFQRIKADRDFVAQRLQGQGRVSDARTRDRVREYDQQLAEIGAEIAERGPDAPATLTEETPTETATDEPGQLDADGRGPLEGAPARDLPSDEAEGDAAARPAPRRGDDPGSGAAARGGRVQPRGGVSDGERAPPVPAERGPRGEREPGRPADAGSDAAEQPRAGDGRRLNRGDPAAREATERAREEAPTPQGATTQTSQPAGERPAAMFTITEPLGTGGPKTKFKANLAAIRTLKTLQEEGRQATADEQLTLSRYVGWGGLPQAFEGDGGRVAKGWTKEAAQLKELLTEAEYEAARRSTQDAHYTSTEIVTAIWDAARHLGFRGGKVLEPSVGTGNFLGLMPDGPRSASEISAVELDPITGGIATQLYPRANVQIMGFQDFTMPDGYFDLAVGNVPFGSQRLYDGKRKAASKFSIHNYFFAKSLDGLAPDGVLAMVVSSRLMDAANSRAREYLAERGELLGAIRLPNNAFLKNAGTEVTTDIIFLRKRREGEEATGETWAETREVTDRNGDSVPLNEYFSRHPEMMLGEWGAFGSMYGPNEPALVARDGQDTPALLAEAIARLPRDVMRARGVVREDPVPLATSVDNVRVGSAFIQDGQVMIRQEDHLGQARAEPAEFKSDKARARVEGMIQVRDAFTNLRKAQLSESASDEALQALRDTLNREYDAFVKAHGPINVDANKRLMRDDPSWPQLSALEENFDKGISAAVAKRTGETPRKPSADKAAIFRRRTQSPYRAPDHASSAQDALATSLTETGRVDMEYMARLYGKTPQAIAEELGELIYEASPGHWETRDAYLSGNVRHKLAAAEALAKEMPRFNRNVEALRAVQPADIEAVDISVKPGAHWLPPDDMRDFARHIAGSDNARAIYAAPLAKWTIRTQPSDSARARWATERVDIDNILEAAANQKQIVVRDKLDDDTTVINEAATNAANEKVERLKAEFRRWIWQDDARRSRLQQLYNETFNTDVQREYDGSHLTFPGKVSDDIITLRPHQANAVWRMVQSGTTLLDHVVGAGKTFTMIAGAMEMRRMGRAQKPMFVVPNHLVGQWAEDFTKLYPGAQVLATSKKDFEKANRKKLFARIATGDWDAVIVAHSSFGKVEMDADFQQRFIEQQIRDIDTAIQALRDQEGKSGRSVKQVEKQKERLKEKLERLFDAEGKDDSLTFGELGIDALFLDEAHEFKNLGFATSMTRVAGLGNPQGSAKAADMFMKVQAVLERTGGNNVVFATGTPISNTMAEMYTMQRYLDYQTLQAQGIAHFDAWANMYGEVVTDWELSPSGTYKLNSRFSKFVNIPELMQRYLSFGDVVSRDDINRQLKAQGKRLPVPKVKGGKPDNVVVARSEDQANYIGEPTTDASGNEVYPQGSLVWRAEHLPKRPEKGADNMLKIMSDARKAALDMRLIDPSAYGDHPGSKVNKAAERIRALYDQWDADRGAQLVFIDLSTPKGARAREAARIRDLIERAEAGDDAANAALERMSPDELEALDSDFSVYDDLRQKLINRGIPEAEIAYIHDANTELQKEELFAKVRSGRVRVLMGSTAKMGAGMNVQERLVGLHHLDAPWRPSDLEQREGRIIRQGNRLYERDPEGFEVEIARYATKQTLDSRMWQTIETKARFIEQVRQGNATTREIEDVGGEASNAAEMKAASSGNPLILEEMDLRQKLRKLEQLEGEHDREQFRIRDRVRALKREVEGGKDRLLRLARDAKQAQKAPKDFTVTVAGQTLTKHKEAGEALLAQAGQMADKGAETRQVGEYAGFPLRLDNLSGRQFVLTLEGQVEHQLEIANIGEADPTGLARRLANLTKAIPDESKRLAARVKQAEKDIPDLEGQLGDWAQAEELAKTRARHQLVINELRPRQQEAAEQDATHAMMAAAGADTPMPQWQPTYRQLGVPPRPEGDSFPLDGRTIKLRPEERPTRREGIRVMVEGIIGPRLYQGKIRGKSKLGFYRERNSEVRVKHYDDVEVIAHEMAHYLDMHYRYNKRFRRAYRDSRYRDEVEALSYTSKPRLKAPEGFAEFVRLWLTQHDQAAARAPLFTQHFKQLLREDAGLAKRMERLQEEMHRWYRQGPRAQLRAKSGKELAQPEQITEWLHTYPMERYRQNVIDKIHAAKVVERTLHGDLLDATISPYKQFQMVNGAESVHEAVMRDGTPRLTDEGVIEFHGKGLHEIFKPASRKGWKRFDLLMDYFKARRAQELKKQGRERLFTVQEIDAGLELGKQYPEFVEIFDEYQAFNTRMLDFYEQMGLIDRSQRKAFADANKNYVPFHRVIERLEDGVAGPGSIGARLRGGEQNVRDIAQNIVEGLHANIRAAMIARAKQTLYRDILNHQDGSLFAVRLAPDARLVTVEQSQLASSIAQAMADVGLSVSRKGEIIPGEGPTTDVADIQAALEANPELLNFWTFGHKPTTRETYVDSAIIDGKRVWLEVRNPLLVDMLTGMRGLRTGPVLNALFRVKNIQTRTVTSMLQFLGPNAVRDTLSAFTISKNRFIPVYDTLVGMGHFMFNTRLYQQFRQQGGSYGTRIEARTEETRSRRQLDLPARSGWDTAAKLLAGYDRFASAFEYGSRLGDFRRALRAGKNPAQAAWEAREVSTDYRKIGRSEIWAKFLRTVPFMNAGIQGVDKVAREIFEIRGEMKGKNLVRLNDLRAQFLIKGSVLSLMSVLLWLINHDDERYRGLTLDEKTRFWWIFIPGVETPIKIPRPYDVGQIFGTLPEVALDYIEERDGKRAAEILGWVLAHTTLGVGDYPGILQPMIEVARNQKFTGAPIVGGRLESVPEEYQFTDRTPILYRRLGETLGVSPLVAEHYAKGYLRYVEAYIADASEALLWNHEEWGPRPFARGNPVDYLTQQFRGNRVPYRTRWTEGYWELKKRAAGARNAMRVLEGQAIRDREGPQRFAEDEVNRLLLGMDQAFSRIDRAFANQEQVLATIKYNPDLTAEQKERQIEDWYREKNRVLEQFYRQAQDALDEVERKLVD